MMPDQMDDRDAVEGLVPLAGCGGSNPPSDTATQQMYLISSARAGEPHKGSRWVLLIDKRGVRHESDEVNETP
jgi:hypothetical protein